MHRAVRHRVRVWLRDHDEVITASEGALLGCSARALRRLAGSGEVLRAGPNVYVDAVRGRGHRTNLRVAVCLGGPGAVVSHLSAAALWGLVDRPPRRPSIIVARTRCTWAARRRGVVVHRSRRPPVSLRRAGFAVTDPVRTLIDVAATCPAINLDRLIDRAYEQGVVSASSLARGVAASRRCPGVRRLRRCLERRGTLDLPEQSVLEGAMNRLIAGLVDDGRLPGPRREYSPPGERIRFDYAWPEVGLAVEVDGCRWHTDSQSLFSDYDRRNGMTVNGWSQLHFTWAHVIRCPTRVGNTIVRTYRRLLAGRLERDQALSRSRAPDAPPSVSAVSPSGSSRSSTASSTAPCVEG